MPGTIIRDAIAVDLLDGLDLEDEGGAQSGTAWDAQWPGDVQFLLEIASVAGSSPVMAVTIQACESANFTTTDVVTLGVITAGDEDDGTNLGFTTYVDNRYVRAVMDINGTSVTYAATLKAIMPHDRRVRSVGPTILPPS